MTIIKLFILRNAEYEKCCARTQHEIGSGLDVFSFTKFHMLDDKQLNIQTYRITDQAPYTLNDNFVEIFHVFICVWFGKWKQPGDDSCEPCHACLHLIRLFLLHCKRSSFFEQLSESWQDTHVLHKLTHWQIMTFAVYFSISFDLSRLNITVSGRKMAINLAHCRKYENKIYNRNVCAWHKKKRRLRKRRKKGPNVTTCSILCTIL